MQQGDLLHDRQTQATAVGVGAEHAVEALKNAFAIGLGDAQGQIDRAKLGRLVFSDSEALKGLEAIVHPLVRQAVEVMATRASQRVIVVEAIKLLEGSLRASCDTVWVTTAPEELQLERLMAKRGMGRDEALTRIHAQPPQKEKIRVASVVIDNSGSFEKTWQQVLTAWKQLVPQPDTPPTAQRTAAEGEFSVIRGRPRDSATIAELITRLSVGAKPTSPEDVMAAFGEKAFLLLELDATPVGDIAKRLDSARARLFTVRGQRIWPGRDEKILTSWNGLMIRGLAIAARHLDRPDYAESATRALDFIRATLWRDGRLLATYKDGKAHLNAYLDDYVFLIDGILELLQVRWHDGDLAFAVELADVVLAHFQDPNGGFFFTADDHETLIQRPKPVADDALPSGNGIAATVLGRLGHLLGEVRYTAAAEHTLHALWPVIELNAHACTALLIATEEYLFPGQTIVLRGSGATLSAWQRNCAQIYAPRRLTLAIPNDAADLPGILRERRTQESIVAYVCSGTCCAPPVDTYAELDSLLARHL